MDKQFQSRQRKLGFGVTLEDVHLSKQFLDALVGLWDPVVSAVKDRHVVDEV